MKKDRKLSESLILLLIGFFLIRGILYSSIVPIWQGPDEPRHFAYIEHLALWGTLPTTETRSSAEIPYAMAMADFDAVIAGQHLMHPPADTTHWSVDPALRYQPAERMITLPGQGTFQGIVPTRDGIIYYLFAAAIYSLLYDQDIFVRGYMIRWLSVVMGGLVVWVAFKTACLLFPDNGLMQIGIPWFVAFQPMFTFMASVINNDSWNNLIAALALYGVLSAVLQGVTVRRSLLLGFLLGLGCLIKETFMPMIPLALMGFSGALWLERGDLTRSRLLRNGLALLFPLVSIWLVQMLLMGSDADVAAWGRRLAVDPLRHSQNSYSLLRFLFAAVPLPDGTAGNSALTTLFKYFWGYFGWLNYPLSAGAYLLLFGASSTAGMGCLICLWRHHNKADGTNLDRRLRFCLWFLGATAIGYVVAVLGMGYSKVLVVGYVRAMQGRYLFPALTAIATLFVLGWHELAGPRWRRPAFMTLAAGFMALDLLVLFEWIIPRYYMVPSLSRFLQYL